MLNNKCFLSGLLCWVDSSADVITVYVPLYDHKQNNGIIIEYKQDKLTVAENITKRENTFWRNDVFVEGAKNKCENNLIIP